LLTLAPHAMRAADWQALAVALPAVVLLHLIARV